MAPSTRDGATVVARTHFVRGSDAETDAAFVNPSPRPVDDPLRPLQVVLILLTTATLGGGFLLLSAAETTTLVDGAIPWNEESPLRTLVRLLCLDYRFPTLNAGEIKGYLLGIGAAAGLIALSLAGLVKPRGRDDAVALDAASASEDGNGQETPISRRGASPLLTAQILALLYVLWSLASSRWSSAPRLAIGGSVLLAAGFVWSFGLGLGLGGRGARIVSRVWIVVTGVTALIAVSYYYGRNPTLRAKFPFGNPTFLSAALMPGILLGLATSVESVVAVFRGGGPRSVVAALGYAIAVAASGWAMCLSDSRAAVVGLWVGALGMLFFVLRRWWKLMPVALVLISVIAGSWYFVTFMDAPSAAGRSATLRLRAYAWSYAWRMFVERPLVGHGQGGFAMSGDSFAVEDVLRDPTVFESRIDHAHCEWLEVMADLGTVGIVLAVAMLLLSLQAGTLRVRQGARTPDGILVGLLGALVALVVEETFSVGLRVCEVPLVFFSVLGLLWAASASRSESRILSGLATPGRRTLAGVVGLVVGAAVLIATQQDFRAARSAFARDTFLQKGDHDSALRAGMSATDRLYPQRALVSLLRLAQVHVTIAEQVHARAADREQRVRHADTPAPRLEALIAEDYQIADEHCRFATRALKEIVSAAPGFMDLGHLDYAINVLQARTAVHRGDSGAASAYLRNAVAALEREIVRQPFEPVLAVEIVRAAGPTTDVARTIELLARPLRYHRLSDAYVDLLGELLPATSFRADLSRVVNEAMQALLSPPDEAAGGEAVENWAPEKLRLGAAVDFLDGEYEQAVRKLEIAALTCERIAHQAPLGAASAYAELADCRFYADPEHPLAAMHDAQRAIELAPDSRPGRDLATGVRQRLIHYHLAADDEPQARRLLRELAPAGVPEPIIEHELGTRFRRLCESLLRRRETENLRRPAESLLPKLDRWSKRALELAPDDPAGRLLAADLAFYRGDDVATAKHLQDALQAGLPLDDALRFLQMALAKNPQSQALQDLAQRLNQRRDDPSPPP